MTKRKVDLLQELLNIPSPSGYEDLISSYIYQCIPKSSIVSKKIDHQRNVIITIKGKDKERSVMIDAHLDEIGFILTNIDKEGLISVQYLGSGDVSILSARDLVILTENGPINAVVDRKHAHLVVDEDSETINSISEAQVDIGIRDKENVEKLVRIGDPVVYKSSINKLPDKYYSGYGFDDKAGCYILIETIKKIIESGKVPEVNLVFTFSAQEEIGSKVHEIVRKVRPELFIEVDVTFATDYGFDDMLEREAGKCELGKGLVVFRGVNIDKEAFKLVEETAKKKKIAIQYQASTGMDGYTSVETCNYGVKSMGLGIPLRNMHTAVEVINLNDINNGVKLLTSMLLSKELINKE